MRSVRIVVGLMFACTLSLTKGLCAPADSSARPATLERPTRSTTTAIICSLVLPGLGQVYTGNYWKAPLFAGIAATSAVMFFRNNADYSTAAAEYDAAIATGTNAAMTNLLLRRREAFRDNRDLSGVVFFITYALAAVDAYVGAELYSFDTGEDLSISLGPSPSGLMAVNLRLTW
ncbi:MAG: hypothetical protein FGM32_08085 [Candidatus Kapabacteria bacterium]|nr:hypothetical protein [Candidatus Kapabacteria bacterium]